MQELLKYLATLNPLDDRAFKILLSDVEQYKNLAEAFTGKTLDEASIIDMKNEIVLSVKGRLIHLDALKDTDIGHINMEAQMIAIGFPFKRHVFHGAATYVNGIQKGDKWEMLKPTTSIVIYKDKGDAELMEDATLSGKLIKTDDDRNQLTLIAINSKKWKDAKTEELRAYLSTFHHGIMTEDNKADFAGVDTNSDAFTKIQRAVTIACAHTKKQENKNKGDDSMFSVLDQYLSKEEREAAEARGEAKGEAKGLNIAWEIINLLKANTPIPEIANKFKIPSSEVEKFKTAL